MSIAAFCSSLEFAHHSTVQNVDGLNFCVRNGNRCFPAALTAILAYDWNFFATFGLSGVNQSTPQSTRQERKADQHTKHNLNIARMQRNKSSADVSSRRAEHLVTLVRTPRLYQTRLLRES